MNNFSFNRYRLVVLLMITTGLFGVGVIPVGCNHQKALHGGVDGAITDQGTGLYTHLQDTGKLKTLLPPQVVTINAFDDQVARLDAQLADIRLSLDSIKRQAKIPGIPRDSMALLKKKSSKHLKARVAELKEEKQILLGQKKIYTVDGTRAFKSFSAEGRPFSCFDVDLKKVALRMFWRNDKKMPYGNFKRFESTLDSTQLLIFACNGGMYTADQSPQGLYIEDGKELRKIETRRKGYGNFYMQPNGVFLLTETNEPVVIKTDDFQHFADSIPVQFATQSGPMLLIDGKINPKFGKDSRNFHVRNGVGVTADHRLILIVSDVKVRFYELAEEFLKLGCLNALYLDGAISETYLPVLGLDNPGGGFGVMIGLTTEVKG